MASRDFSTDEEERAQPVARANVEAALRRGSSVTLGKEIEMMRWSAIIVVLCAGCVHVAPHAIETASLVGEYWNGDGFWPRSLVLKRDGTFSYTQMTDTMRMIDDEHFEFEGSWTLSGHWTFVPPDKIEMATDGKPERITVFVRRSKRAEIAILEPDMFSDILATWSDDGSLRYLKKQKKTPNQSPEPTPTAVTIPADAGLAPAVVVAHL